MSIQDHTYLTESVARSICNTGDDSLKDFTGGFISDSDESRINAFIETELNNSTWPKTGNVPNSVYINVSQELERYTSGMDRFAIANILKTNNLFGASKRIQVNVDAESLDESVQDYNTQVNVVQEGHDKLKSDNMTGGYFTDATNQIGNESRDVLQSIVRKFDDKVRIDRKLSTSINSVMSGIPNVHFASLPTGAKRVLSDMVRHSQVSVFRSGKVLSIGGGSLNINELSIDVNTGNFGIDFGSLDHKQRSSVASRTVIEETAMDPETEQAMAEEIESSGIGTTLGVNNGRYTVVNSDPIQIGEGMIVPGVDYISSVEELEYEMGSMTRDISEIILHWSETYTDANLSAESLQELTGAGRNAYHLIVKRDGSVQRGVPMNATGDHCDINNHNAYSIGVCLIGGINVSSGDTELEQLGANSITRSQFNSLYHIFRTFFNHYPGGQALGHMDVDVSQDDPGFDVRDYAYNNFNKTSLYTDPLNQSALSPSDILASLERDETVIVKDPDVMDKRF